MIKPGRRLEDTIPVDDVWPMQNKVSWSERDQIANGFAQRTNMLQPNPFTGRRHPEQVAKLSGEGLVPLGTRADSQQCRDILDYFTATPCYSAHVPVYSDNIARPVSEVAEGTSSYGSYTLEQNLCAPHIPELILNPDVLDIAGAYLGCIPTVYSINTFWTFPRPKRGGTHEFHRDEDDFRFIAVFYYWTDVEKGEGEFYFARNSHKIDGVNAALGKPELKFSGSQATQAMDAEIFRRIGTGRGGNGYGYDPLYETVFKDDLICITGPAGTAVAVDAFGIHKGTVPASRPRLCTWIRYGFFANETYHVDKTKPAPRALVEGRIPREDWSNYAMRLLVTD